MNDQDYLRGIREGSPEVIRQFYSKYFGSILQYITQNNGTPDDAKDVFQDAIMVIFQKAKTPDFQLQYSIHTYLYTICRNTWLKKIRNKSDRWGTLPEDLVLKDENAFEEEILWRDKERLYREKFKELGEACQKVLTLFLKGISMTDIAETMGFSSVGYAKKRKYKCKNQLMKLIQSDQRYVNLVGNEQG